MTPDDAMQLWIEQFGRRPQSVTRLRTGLCHYVFLVQDRGEKSILRIARPENRAVLAGSVYWIGQLSALALPIPQIRVAALEHAPPFLVLAYIEGEDLGHAYPALSSAQRREVANALWAIQQKLSSLESGASFGYLASLTAPRQHADWASVVRAHLARSRGWIRSCGLFDEALVDAVEHHLPAFEPYFRTVRPVAFLDDATTKNLLVAEGRLSGIVDLDWLCFGDPLYNIALTRMALLAASQDTEYIDFLLEAAQAGASQRRVLDFYTLVFCVDFIGGAGMHFNKDAPPVPSEAEKACLLGKYDALIRALA